MKKKLGWILSLTICFALIIAATLVTASADTSVSYIDANGDELTCANATVVTSNSTTWNDGWYVVNGDVTIDQHVTVTGDVHLILADGCTLNASQGITVADNDSDVNNGSANSLTIYGQSGGTGKLTADRRSIYQAGIGGDRYQTGGTITITGGTVTATGNDGAGIGGGSYIDVDNGTFSTGTSGNAVIIASSISYNDDTNGWDGVIFQGATGQVYGTSVTPTGDFTVPAGSTLTIEANKTLTIPSGVTLTNNGTITVESGGTLMNNGTIVNNGTIKGTVSGSGNVLVNTHYLDTTNNTQNIQANLVTPGSTTWGAADDEEHWYVVNGDVTIDQRVTVTGDVHLILAEGSNLTVNGGIDVSNDNSLTIYAQSTNEETMGKLTATGIEGKAGIGGTGGSTININGGNIKAKGDSSAAGIGDSNDDHVYGNGKKINITGGIVNAESGYAAVAIGGQNFEITISGGNVTAKAVVASDPYAYYAGAGIGGGWNGNGGSVTITGGVVNATGAKSNRGASAGIGSGFDECGNVEVKITGGFVTATGGGSGAAGIGAGSGSSGDTFSTGDNSNAVIIASSISDKTMKAVGAE